MMICDIKYTWIEMIPMGYKKYMYKIDVGLVRCWSRVELDWVKPVKQGMVLWYDFI